MSCYFIGVLGNAILSSPQGLKNFLGETDFLGKTEQGEAEYVLAALEQHLPGVKISEFRSLSEIAEVLRKTPKKTFQRAAKKAAISYNMVFDLQAVQKARIHFGADKASRIIRYFKEHGVQNPKLHDYIHELVYQRALNGLNSSAAILVNGLIDFMGDDGEDERLEGLKIDGQVHVSPSWFHKFSAVWRHPETCRAFLLFFSDYQYGFTYPSRLANLAAVIANSVLGRPAFHREVLDHAMDFHCDTIYFDPHFGSVAQEVPLHISLKLEDPNKIRIADIGCGVTRSGSVTMNFLINILAQVLNEEDDEKKLPAIEATGIDIHFPKRSVYPQFDEKYRFKGWEKVFNFDAKGIARLEIKGRSGSTITERYLDASRSEFNVVSPQFALGHSKKFDIVISSMLAIDFPPDEQKKILENLLSLLAPGGILFLNATSKNLVKSWDYFEIWHHDPSDGKFKVTEAVIPFEVNPYTSKFQTDFIVEGKELKSQRKYIKRDSHFLYAWRREIVLAIDTAKRFQKRGVSVWKNILAAQKAALDGKPITDILIEILQNCEGQKIREFLDRVHHEKHQRGHPLFDEVRPWRLNSFFARESLSLGHIHADSAGKVYFGENRQLPHRYAYLFLLASRMNLDSFTMTAALYLRNARDPDHYLSPSFYMPGPHGGKISVKIQGAPRTLLDDYRRKVLKYQDALTQLRALASLFEKLDFTEPNVIPDFLSLFVKYASNLFPPFREERRNILLFWLFSRFLDFCEGEALGPQETKYLLSPLASYLDCHELAQFFMEVAYFKTGHPENYQRLQEKMEYLAGMKMEAVEAILKGAKEKLEQAIQNTLGLKRDEFEITWRIKNLYSLFLKINDQTQKKFQDIEDLNDLFGLRILVRDTDQIERVVQIIRENFKGLAEAGAATKRLRSRLLSLFQNGILPEEGFIVPGIPESHLKLFIMTRLDPVTEIPIELQLSTFDNVPALDTHWAYKLRRELNNDPAFTSRQSVDIMMFEKLYGFEFLLLGEEGKKLKIKKVPRMSRERDLPAMFDLGPDWERSTIDGEIENARLRTHLHPTSILSMDIMDLRKAKETSSEYLRTGQIILKRQL
ncbi:MAG: hypothetical protein Q8P84_03650 [Deltaproteobacteria bacterium]|nr:hypothetical protein [Deltaproteobacteria bacterium]